MSAGNGQILSVNFVPTDTRYNSASKTVTINVLKADQVISWSDPTGIPYGTALSAAQLNAGLTSGDGALTYDPAIGVVLNAGDHQALQVDAAETGNFKAATATVHIDVNPKAASVTPNAAG